MKGKDKEKKKRARKEQGTEKNRELNLKETTERKERKERRSSREWLKRRERSKKCTMLLLTVVYHWR